MAYSVFSALSTYFSNVAMQKRHFKAVLFYFQQKQQKETSLTSLVYASVQLSAASSGQSLFCSSFQVILGGLINYLKNERSKVIDCK